jgi:hypothetical protein
VSLIGLDEGSAPALGATCLIARVQCVPRERPTPQFAVGRRPRSWPVTPRTSVEPESPYRMTPSAEPPEEPCRDCREP